MISTPKLQALAAELDGDLFFDDTMRTLYATDASAYRETPTAVAVPATESDIKKLILFAKENGTSVIPRTAGTSLAGQVVGGGIVVDVSKRFKEIIEVNEAEGWARVQPGIVRDVLNIKLKERNLYYGPETSTANRAMIGGMVGNNSCGANSIVYGSARDQLISVKGFLSDGSQTEFTDITVEEFEQKCQGPDSLETSVYRQVREILSAPENQEEIRKEFPKPSIKRRNTGYAIDLLLETEPFTEGAEPFNFCKLIAGSEGTLMFVTELKVKLAPLPPKHKALVCTHFHTIDESLRANIACLAFRPSASELIDKFIMDCTKENIAQRENRFFIDGDPGAILVVEIARDTEEERDRDVAAMIADFKAKGYGYHYPVLYGNDMKKIWALRKAGLGLLSNIPGDAKPAPVIEDTAVDPEDLPEYIREFNVTLDKRGLSCVHYAHAGTGELHLRPIINLKTEEGNEMFHTIADDIAKLVKKYRGSLSGEHGDGRLRGEFIPYMVGEKNFKLIKRVKRAWDPHNVFNPGKIVDTPKMNEHLRYVPGQATPEYDTVFDFTGDEGILRGAERCNGSGDCRKTELSGGTMCPSYMATGDEKHTTRARANVMREALTAKTEGGQLPADEMVKEVMDLCLSCKGCKSECPSNVDLAKLKAEFLQHYYDQKGAPFRAQMIAYTPQANKMAELAPWAYNMVFGNEWLAKPAKKMMGFATERSIPLLHKTTLNKWFDQNGGYVEAPKRKVFLFSDEFTNYNDTPIGITTIKLLTALGYEVEIPKHIESGRTFLSKGFLKKARKVASKNVAMLKDLISEESPLLGVEPSAILTFRDEYKDLLRGQEQKDAEQLAGNVLTIDEFLARELDASRITPDMFHTDKKLIKVHGHCHQKALSSLVPMKKILSAPANYEVHMIPSGCCGMAGSFGYEEEHYETSMAVGELVLFPTVRKQAKDTVICAPGTSCRHQIKDGTGRQALHPVEILWNALTQ
ncbi:oxidoreductase [Fulvitalea axinellae]|uniref:Oxidoreductase n=1 Tax=Fulvitalea axinellae TaxID=1182444 RepID=A0AAU9CLW3_9BACT|nr:oxidoreductase [Fulvitalea axinellae]